MAQFGDRVKETTDTTGTGTIDLNGAPTGFRAFADEFADAAADISYLIVDDPDDPTDYEYGKGTLTYGTPNTLSRDTVEGSSNSDAKVSFSAGTKTVIATPTSADLTSAFASGSWGIKSSLVRAITTSGTQLAADDGKTIDADSSASSPATLTYTLLAAATAGDGFTVTVKNTGASGSVVVDANGSETIDGALTVTLDNQYDILQIRCDGTDWHIVGPGYPTEGRTNESNAWTADQYFTPMSDSSGSNTLTVDFAGGNYAEVILTENITTVNLNSMSAGGTYKIRFRQAAAASYTVSGWASSITWINGDTDPTMNPTFSAFTMVTIEAGADSPAVHLGSYQDFA